VRNVGKSVRYWRSNSSRSSPEGLIERLEVNDLNFELAFLERLRQDGSGEKGFESLDQNFVFHVERE
jgi:hypothetical protein